MRKREYTSLFIKYLQTEFLKATQPLQCDTIAKLNIVCSGNIAPGHRSDFANSVGRSILRPRAILPKTLKKQLLLHYYEMYLQVAKALLNNLQSKAAKIRQKKNSSEHKQMIGFYIWTYKERKVLE